MNPALLMGAASVPTASTGIADNISYGYSNPDYSFNIPGGVGASVGALGGLVGGAALGKYATNRIRLSVLKDLMKNNQLTKKQAKLLTQGVEGAKGARTPKAVNTIWKDLKASDKLLPKTSITQGVKAAEGLAGKSRALGTGLKGLLARNPEVAMIGGGLVGASVLSKMLAHNLGDSQKAEKAQQVQAANQYTAYANQQDLRQLATIPTIRY